MIDLNMGRRLFRQRRTITKVSRPDIEDVFRKDQVYKLNGYDCDLLVKDFNAKEVYLIEEKTSLNNYNYGVAALQLLLGESKIHRYTSFKVIKKIILAEESKLFNEKQYHEDLILENDLHKFLGISIIVKNQKRFSLKDFGEK